MAKLLKDKIDEVESESGKLIEDYQASKIDSQQFVNDYLKGECH